MQNLKNNLGEKEKDKSGPLTTNSNLSYPKKAHGFLIKKKKAHEIFMYYQKHKCPYNRQLYYKYYQV